MLRISVKKNVFVCLVVAIIFIISLYQYCESHPNQCFYFEEDTPSRIAIVANYLEQNESALLSGHVKWLSKEVFTTPKPIDTLQELLQRNGRTKEGKKNDANNPELKRFERVDMEEVLDEEKEREEIKLLGLDAGTDNKTLGYKEGDFLVREQRKYGNETGQELSQKKHLMDLFNTTLGLGRYERVDKTILDPGSLTKAELAEFYNKTLNSSATFIFNIERLDNLTHSEHESNRVQNGTKEGKPGDTKKVLGQHIYRKNEIKGTVESTINSKQNGIKLEGNQLTSRSKVSTKYITVKNTSKTVKQNSTITLASRADNNSQYLENIDTENHSSGSGEETETSGKGFSEQDSSQNSVQQFANRHRTIESKAKTSFNRVLDYGSTGQYESVKRYGKVDLPKTKKSVLKGDAVIDYIDEKNYTVRNVLPKNITGSSALLNDEGKIKSSILQGNENLDLQNKKSDYEQIIGDDLDEEGSATANEDENKIQNKSDSFLKNAKNSKALSSLNASVSDLLDKTDIYEERKDTNKQVIGNKKSSNMSSVMSSTSYASSKERTNNNIDLKDIEMQGTAETIKLSKRQDIGYKTIKLNYTQKAISSISSKNNTLSQDLDKHNQTRISIRKGSNKRKKKRNGLLFFNKVSCKSLDPKLVLYNRIFKTASTSINKYLLEERKRGYLRIMIGTTEDWYKTGDSFPYPDIIEKYASKSMVRRVYSGHFYFRPNMKIKRSYTYINQVREPFQRIVSHYHYMRYSKDRPKNRIREMMETGEFNETLSECFEKQHRGCENNVMTRFFCGEEALCENGTAKAVELAKYNMKHFYAAIGLTEHFNLYLKLLRKRLPKYFRLSQFVPHEKPGVYDGATARKVPSKLKERIKKANAADYEIYQYARTLFYGQLKACGIDETTL
ncbi:uncharacterized protein LOC135695312 [Rhopilema esculentum]|uniref:uncharacterized protein LOC135695312 n=1 Tax=Rhopilema esculentum TaxID=499914 RepID=UPI0031D23A06